MRGLGAIVVVFVLSGCGGSSSETPFPPEPPDVNLDVEDLGQERPPTAAEAKAGATIAAPPTSAAPAAPESPQRLTQVIAFMGQTVAEFYSKVTRRPRSKLERVVSLLEGEYELPPRPESGLLVQLVLYYLLWGEAPAAKAAERVKTLRNEAGKIDRKRLALVDDSFVADVCAAVERHAQVISALHKVAKIAETLPEDCASLGLEELRKRLILLPRLPAEQADFILLGCGAAKTVAPSSASLRVAARLGYPGGGYPSISRALDAELPERDLLELAWRAHHVLRLHAARVCTQNAPRCDSCHVQKACSYAGLGEDPAARLEG